MSRFLRWSAAVLLIGSVVAPLPLVAATVLQCVPYARIVSGVDLHGDALTWWDQAGDQYKRGHKPKKGAVLAFKPKGPMTLGHVAVVSKVLDDRRVLVRHANWSVPGSIEEDVLAIDVSEEGDWSQVRIWHSPTAQMGARTNPTYGFIYPAKAKLHSFTPDPALGSSVRFASVDPDVWDGAEKAERLQKRERKDSTRAIRTASLADVGPRGTLRATPSPRAPRDPFIVEYADGGQSVANTAPSDDRSLGDIIADVKREVALN
jgi:surface antigen